MSIQHLSTRCPECGDSVGMPPVSEPQPALYGDSLHVALHLCPNVSCSGTTVGYYRRYLDHRRETAFEYIFHRPEYHMHTVPEAVPERPRTLLQDANDAKKAPTACAQAAVKAVEAMLAHKGIVGSQGVKGRIKNAVTDGILPQVMADWAEEIRTIANTAHTDVAEEAAPLPDKAEAERALKFANTLAEYLFVLPDQIQKSRGKKSPKKKT